MVNFLDDAFIEPDASMAELAEQFVSRGLVDGGTREYHAQALRVGSPSAGDVLRIGEVKGGHEVTRRGGGWGDR